MTITDLAKNLSLNGLALLELALYEVKDESDDDDLIQINQSRHETIAIAHAKHGRDEYSETLWLLGTAVELAMESE